jgi:hypothetical protein
MDEPLSKFDQKLTSPVKTLVLAPRQQTKIPVTIGNPGTEAWASAGSRPINVGYRIYRNGKMLSEGERTSLPGVVAGGKSADVQVRLTAPSQSGQYTVRISLVQEAVAWFMNHGSGVLELPLTVR